MTVAFNTSARLRNANICCSLFIFSSGAVLGKTSPAQTLGMVMFELIFYALNFQICVTSIGATDIGGTVVLHTFGAYFGLSFSRAIS